jgi:hypothetical protein
LALRNQESSSIFKHLNRNYNDFQFTEKEYIEFRDSIYSNVLSATRTISRNLLENSTVSFDDPDNYKRTTKIAEFCDKTTNYKRYYTSDQYTPEIHEMIVELWKENIMMEKFQNQHENFHFCEGLEYFLNRIDKLKPPNYIPSFDDILNCGKRTIGYHF